MEKKILGEEEVKPQSKIKWFFMVILVPSIFALAVAIVVATVAGVNVYEKAIDMKESLPFLSSKEREIENRNDELESKLTGLNEKIKVRESTIANLKDEVENKDEEIKKLELEKTQLEKEISELAKIQTEDKNEFKDIVKTYESMSAKKAAPIITHMNEEEALDILANLKPDTLASIMEQMNADNAAKYTTLLSKESDTKSDY